ncbi:MAG: aminotransferase class V-fold PLP-dependent enzyme, partial [Alphaproteobacteria bacterium]|nr:aminotransferase class V-fold PLP-dependent enzyme [Alphaproteobacteria bacterium]
PTRFMQRLPAMLRHAAARLAGFVGAEARDIAFVDNATTGCNAVLRSLTFAPGDEILMLDHGYGAVRNAARHVAAQAGARLVEAATPFPHPEADAIVAAFAACLTPRTRLAVVDHVTSPSALVLPLEQMIAACRKAGVPVLVDGAHGPGQLDLDLAALGADWYAGNCHKWLMAPKGCGFLWARRDRQEGLHPVTISHGYGQGFTSEFDWTGTRDPSSYLAVETALDLHEAWGGARLRRRNAELARDGARRLAERLGTECGADERLHGAMWLVRVPLPGPATPEGAQGLRRTLIDQFQTDVPINALAGAFWARISAGPYNELADYELLAARFARYMAAA